MTPRETRRRTASGESSIYRDAAGRWHGYVSMGLKDNGRRDRRHVSGTTRAAVVEKVRDLERKRDAGTATAAGRAPTLAQWLDHWLTTIAAPRLRPSTAARYRLAVDKHLVPKLGHHRLDRLQPEHLEAAYASLGTAGLAPASVLYAHRVLSRALKVALQRGRVTRNVAGLVEAPTVRRQEVIPLSAEESRRILTTASGRRNAARWSVALALGLRQGEALGLRWRDVDLGEGTLAIRHALQRQPGRGLIFTEPKSAAGRRALALPPPLLRARREHRDAPNRGHHAAGSGWHHYRLVFAQPSGQPIDPSADYAAWKGLLRAAGVRAARLHDARHTAATLLLTQGVPARVAMQILGHSQISLTLGTYSHVAPELARDATERVGRVLWDDVATTLAPPPLDPPKR